jgi:hypothetical protein
MPVSAGSAAKVTNNPQNYRKQKRNQYAACYGQEDMPVFRAYMQVAWQPEKAESAQNQKHRSKGCYYYTHENQPFTKLSRPEFHHKLIS